MLARRMLIGALMSALVVTGCRRAEPEEPTPVQQTDDEAARRQAEEAARLAAEEAARREAEADEARLAAERERAVAVLTERIHFAYDESAITPDSRDVLLQKVEVLRQNGDVRLRIIGHADERGSIEYNLALGMRRANAARDFLTNYGLEVGRFETASMGEEEPLVNQATESAYAQNRRAEFQIAAGTVR